MQAKRAQRRNMLLAQRTLRSVEAAEKREAFCERISGDLAARGVSPALCESVARELGNRARFDSLTAEAYDAMIEGAVLACGVREPVELAAPSEAADPAQIREIERMMEAFSGELHKLDESLELLSAYVQRMRKKPQPAPPAEAVNRGRHTLH